MLKIKINKNKLKKLLKPTENSFQSLVKAIIYQQLSTKSANSIYAKFLNLFPKNKFPKPKQILELKEGDFKKAGISSQKMIYLKDLANHFESKKVSHNKLIKMNDSEIKEALIKIKGIGPWSIDMFLIFGLNRENILPLGDLGIKKGFVKAFKLKNLPSEIEMVELSKSHIGELTYLSLHLWNEVDGE